jgi:hypothetical protein
VLDFLAQVTVPCNDFISDLRIVYYFTGTGFTQSLMPQQVVVVATLAETVYKIYF